MKLALKPTRTLAGKVELGTTSRTKCFVMASAFDATHPGGYLVMSPIKPDGTFSMEGVTPESIKIGVAIWGMALSANVTFMQIPAGGDKLDVVLTAPSTVRTLDVIVRSQVAMEFDAAQVFLMPGKADYKLAGDMMTNHHMTGMQVQFAKAIVGEAIPKSAVGKTRKGDLIAHFANVVAGDITVCALGINGDLGDPKLGQAIQTHSKELVMKCATPGAGETAIVVEAPPQKRFD
jgi:hypothetical protein